MEDNKFLTQEELNLYYYEKMVEKTYLFTRNCERWTDLDDEFIDETTSETEYLSYVLFPDYCGNGLMLHLVKEGYELSLKDLLNLFTDPLDPTPEEFTLFNLEYGVNYIIKPNGGKRNDSIQKYLE